MKTKLLSYVLLSTLTVSTATAQTFVHGKSDRYTYPQDSKVLEKLDNWQDQKFGMLIHYGLYSELGIVESWTLCNEDWIGRDSTITYQQYKDNYWATSERFNPTKIDPASWAKYRKLAGMKYMVFTTKHHDGFNMFDTKYSDFSIAKGPFKNDPLHNIDKEVFNAFRNEGYMIGVYYSKPDWHSQYYWWDKYSTPDRNPSYNIDANKWCWNKFKEYTYNQIHELMNGDYGSMNILWLDGGWVRPSKKGDEGLEGDFYKGSQDIDMPKIAAMARSYQPGLLVVDRTVSGEYENYQTPENGIPKEQLNNPWESCITLGGAWGFVKNDNYKSNYKVIAMLSEIVAKGGSLLLGVEPAPDGTLPSEAAKRLTEIGEWTSKNGEAIYNTRITAVYNDGTTWFTQSKDGRKCMLYTVLKKEKHYPKLYFGKVMNL